MISHSFIGVNDSARCFGSCSPIMAILGRELRFRESARPRAALPQPGAARPLFVIGAAENGHPAAPGNGQ
jgi:hypothetical protein